MEALPTELRSRLESAVREARQVAETGAIQALDALAVREPRAPDALTAEQRALRNRLRLHGRQLGDALSANGPQTMDRLVREVAYEHWHRMMFARFLAENHLLVEPASGVSITIEECEDLARERGADPWALAASFAQDMLPRIFRTDDPALAVALPPETSQALQALLSNLPGPVFEADDSLGWTYQFWQAAEKDRVNERVKSGEKITGETLPAVTQLFTEPYMVQFLLHNAIGAWHAGRALGDELSTSATSEDELRHAVRLTPLGGYEFTYLRFVREPVEDDGGTTGPWRPASGTFDDWPRSAAELKVLDPCCGSGHFLVAAFELLVRLRMQEEGLSTAGAVHAVLADNLFGLELDARCTQIAAFNLALAAWKKVGSPIELPPLQIACSGMAPAGSREQWIDIAEQAAVVGGMAGGRDLFGPDDTLLTANLRGGFEALYDLFVRAPELGSLLDPVGLGGKSAQTDALRADFSALEPLLDAVLAREDATDDAVERAVAARGMAQAARILVGPPGGYTLVITNVPYLGRGSHSDWFKEWADANHGDAKNDLATIFVSRMLRWVGKGKRTGTVAAVTPQNWLFLTTYRELRERLLKERTWDMVARLGPGAFETIGGHVVNVVLVSLSGERAHNGQVFAGLDGTAARTPAGKAALLRGETIAHSGEANEPLISDAQLEDGIDVDEVPDAGVAPPDGSVWLVPHADQLKNPDARITTMVMRGEQLSRFAVAYKGICTGDYPRFGRKTWEVHGWGREWSLQQSTSPSSCLYGGREHCFLWEQGAGSFIEFLEARFEGNSYGAWLRGLDAWGNDGVVVTVMSDLKVARYAGAAFDNNVSVIVPRSPENIGALWAFCSSPEYSSAVRRINPKLSVTDQSFLHVPFDHLRWQKIADEQYPNGLPEPYSDDPTQWLFHGHPAHAEPGTELQVAVARLLGYRWPAELDRTMRLSAEARALIERSRELDAHGFTDPDGIVCLSPTRGESSAADRLRSLLAAAFGDDWSPARLSNLLAAPSNAKHGAARRASLEEWLRDAFFEEHCKLFHHRPFVWHVWDGLRDGFHALVSYHKLAGADGVGRRTLDALSSTYLGEWIDRQRDAVRAGKEGADARLAAAVRLQEELNRILDGEPPYDVFVRWKPLPEQAIGWEPDLNDGVRLNIRPFLNAVDVGRSGAGILRWKPNVTWRKDRGKEPESLRPREAFPWFWGCQPERKAGHRTDFGADTPGAAVAAKVFDGARWNDLHYTRAAKLAARGRVETGS
jgi:hypothetical protein